MVITGGASGLGRCIAETFGMRGASVAVLDVKEVEGGVGAWGVGCRWYRCDVGDFDEVQKVRGEIEKDVCRTFSFTDSIVSNITDSRCICDYKMVEEKWLMLVFFFLSSLVL